MIVDLRKIKVYVISPGEGKYESRLRNAMTLLKNAGFEDIEHVKSVPDPNLANSLAKTNLVIFEKEKHRTDPFMIIEDDIAIENTVIHDDMWVLSIPEDATAVYLGACQWIYPYAYHTLQTGRDIRIVRKGDHVSYDDRLIQIKGMTSTHAILFIDRLFLQILTWCVQSHCHLQTAHDLILATLQQIYPVYAMKQPFFYQDEKQGGQQLETRLVWINEHDFFSRRIG